MNTKYRFKGKCAVVVMMLLAGGLLLSSCDKLNFGDINTNPTQVSQLNPALLFTTTEEAVSGTRYEVWRSDIIYTGSLSQQIVTGLFGGGNNYSITPDWEHAFFEAVYSGGVNGKEANRVRRIQTVIHLLKEAKKMVKKVANKLAEANILRTLIFSRLTDLYGDVPYFQAGKAAISGITKPKFTPQDSIYMDFFKQLKKLSMNSILRSLHLEITM